jgi:predicted membrane-bound spermidine synthase
VRLVFAPALGIACCQVLAGLCGVVAVLFTVLAGKQWLFPNDGMAATQAFLLAAVFVAAALGCLWFVKVIRRLAGGE